MDSCTTSMWMKFFTDSGIPNSVAANYAVIFVENRMTRNMLLDLNKEILRDMDVHVMGDVIAILKHAKVVHAQMTREKVYQNEPSVASVSPVAQARLASLATSAKISREERIDIPSPAVGRTVGSTALKRKRVVAPQSDSPTKKMVVRRVLPEHEGPYKISMPSGSTPKTRKLLAQIGTKESVFERLGNDSNDATVSTTKNLAVETPAARAGIRRLAKPSTLESSSVFQRLGPGKNDGSNTEDEEMVAVTSSTPATVRQAKKRVVLEPDKVSTMSTSVRPILKNRLGPKVATVAKTSKSATSTPITVTMAAPARSAKSTPVVRFAAATPSIRTGTQGILGKSRGSVLTKSIYSRLGDKDPKKAVTESATMTIHVKRTPTVISKGDEGSGKSSVFRRLGPPALDI